MKNYSVLFLALLLGAIFLLPSVAQGQAARQQFQVPPITCGLSNATDPALQKCCNNSVTAAYDEQTNGILTVFPSGIRDIFVGFNNVIKQAFFGVPIFEATNTPCLNGIPQGTGPACTCVNAPSRYANESAQLKLICERYIDPRDAYLRGEGNDANKKALAERMEYDRNKCLECAATEKGFYTGMGCIPSNLGTFITDFVLRIGIGIAGFVAFMCIIYSSFLLQTSRGNPETVQKARDQITSCIIGLIMIIFSIFILRLIGVDILRLPGFS